MICCVDTSNIFFICWSMFVKDYKEKNGEDSLIKEEDLGLFYHMLFRKMMEYLSTYKDVVLCYEGPHSTAWRKKIWPPYKENRKKDDPNFKWVGQLMEKTYDFFSLFHTKNLKVENCEGDDCIYATCKYYSEKGEQVRIVSTDKDLSQIMNYYDTVSQYNPIKKQNVSKNENILIEKALIGDMSDNIKAIRGIGEKTLSKMLEDKNVWNKKMTPENQLLYEKVMQIIDLRQYPKEYQKNIEVELDKPFNEFKPIDIEKFLIDNGLKQCYNDWVGKWLPDIQALNFEHEDAMDEIMDMLGE